jgi:hypothetical protein
MKPKQLPDAIAIAGVIHVPVAPTALPKFRQSYRFLLATNKGDKKWNT